ncbi:uncharacterized protein LOC100897742 [Galendromus occidentalis]|uniref:Uncharacterized protein LOC100897742 n=1 Tax=Galendromus occidentalis TaxID=34638 RepID=A0AAJ6QTI2_9ACAR|nr:uncharacterized protein LOC100897742 [Galendromus occidentalis]
MLELSRETRRHSETNFTYGAFTFYAAEMRYSERKMKYNQRRRLSCGSPSLLRKPMRLMSQASYDARIEHGTKRRSLSCPYPTRENSEPSSVGNTQTVAFERFPSADAFPVKPTSKNAAPRQKTGGPDETKKEVTIGPFCTEVFLGGSCNPTQWRRDEAIPALKSAKVTFYNPQTEDWLPDLINLEQQAKDHARVLLFVHDKETRSLASMVEVGERSALKKQTLVLVIEELGDQVMGEKLSEGELKEMRRGRNYMRDIAEMCGIRVFTQIREAVQSCIDIVKGTCTKAELLPKSDGDLGEKFINTRRSIDNYSTNNELSLEERGLALQGLCGRSIPKEYQMSEKPFINETEFLMIVSEYRYSLKPPLIPNFLRTRTSSDKCPVFHNTVFICGPVGNLDWKRDIACPYFTKHLISARERSDPDAEHLMPMEMKQILKCRVLLFVFPKDTWGAAEMIMASYYIALNAKKVVLCTQQVCENVPVYGERLTPYQAKDYNRIRMYLSDQASRNGVPVYDSITEAVAKAADLAKE